MPIVNIDDKSCQTLYNGVDRNPYVQLFQGLKFRYILPLPADRQASLIDVGCGRGNFLRNLARRGYVDLSGLDVDNALYPDVASHVAFYKQSLTEPGLDLGRRFKHVFVQCMLHHLPPATLPDVARNLARLCEPGGELFIYEPNMATPIGNFFYFTFLRLFPAMHCNALAEKDEQLAFCKAWNGVVRSLEALGFRPRISSNWSFYKCYVATYTPAARI